MRKNNIYLTIITVLILAFVSGCVNVSESNNAFSKVTSANIFESNNNSSNGTSSNITNSCWADDVSEINSLTENDESIFYLSEVGIIKLDKRQNTKTVLVAGKSINSFRISNDLIYFCENDNAIYRVSLNGENRVKIVEMSQVEYLLIEKNLANFEVYEDYIYIESSGTSLIRFSLSTQKAENFADDVSEYVFGGNYFYYIDHAESTYSIFRKDLKTGQINLLRGDGKSKRNNSQEDFEKYKWYDNVIAINNQLYYTMRGPAKLFKLEQSGNDTLIDGFDHVDDAEYLMIANNKNKLYYMLESGSLKGHLFEYDTQTRAIKEMIVLDDVHSAFEMKVINGYVFYYSLNKNLVYLKV